MARLGPPFWPPKSPPKKFMWVPFCILSQELRHINFFRGAQNGAFWVGAKKFMLQKFMRFFGPLVLQEIWISPVIRKSAWKDLRFKNQKLERKADHFGSLTVNFWFLTEKSCRHFGGIFVGSTKYRPKNIRDKKIRSSWEIFRANFVLQMCKPKDLWWSVPYCSQELCLNFTVVGEITTEPTRFEPEVCICHEINRNCSGNLYLKSDIFCQCSLRSVSALDIPIRGAQFAADRIAPIRSDLKSHDSNRNPKSRSIRCDVFTNFSNV